MRCISVHPNYSIMFKPNTMKNPTIILNFRRLSDANLEIKAQAISAAMTGNANFPTPTPDLAAFNTMIQAYSDALSAAKTRDKVKVSIKKDRRAELVALLIQLANYVSFTAAGDRSILMSSGFDLGRDSANPQPLQKPQNFKVSFGENSGELITSLSSVAGARTYIHQITPAPATDQSIWESVYLGSVTNTFSGLEPLKQYCFRVAVAGSKGQVVYTEIITKTAV